MSAKLILKNGTNTEFEISHSDSIGAKKIESKDIVQSVATIADMEALTNKHTGQVVIVKDSTTGGTFIYSTVLSATNNYGTIINGWVRQYSGHADIKWFGAIGNGIVDDTVALQHAIQYALTSLSALVLNGTFLVSNTIGNLHDVILFGSASIVRDGVSYSISDNSVVTNNLYVSTIGSDLNDGMTPSYPFATIQKAIDTYYKCKNINATVKINVASGTYSQIVRLTGDIPTNARVELLGASVANGTVPTTIITAPVLNTTCIYAQNGVGLKVEDIKFVGFKKISSISSSSVISAITATSSCDLYTNNVHIYDCDLGIYCTSNSIARISYGVIDMCGSGVTVLFNSTYTIGYNGTLADANGVTGLAIKSCIGSGVLAQEGATGHVDYTYISGCANAVNVQSRARAHILGSVIASNANGIRAGANSTVYLNKVIPNTYSLNTTTYVFASGAVEEEYEIDFHAESGVLRDVISKSNNTVSPAVAFTHSIDANMLSTRGAGFEYSGTWKTVGTAGTKDIILNVAGFDIYTYTMPSTITNAIVNFKLVNITNSLDQDLYITILNSDGTVVVALVNTLTFNFSLATQVTIKHLVANISDTSVFTMSDFRITH